MITSQTHDLSDVDFQNGEVILINKPINWTSFNVVDKVRRLTKIKKVGHTGTLDPKATGLLILCTGAKTKTISSYQDLMKEYQGKIYFGKSTPTMDSESIDQAPDEKDIENLNKERIISAAKKFTGEIYQVPPPFSAIWVEGRRSYRLARKGREIRLKPRKVYIEVFDIVDFSSPLATFVVSCSKGTYIRKLVHDLGEEIGCGAFLYELKRTKIGLYKLEEAIELEDFAKLFESRIN